MSRGTGKHASLFDLAVRPAYRQRGIGTCLAEEAVKRARQRGAEWLHVDYEPNLAEFYRRVGFGTTEAGLIRLG